MRTNIRLATETGEQTAVKITHTLLAAALLLSATAFVAAPAAGAKTKKPEADLATQRVTIGQRYVVVKPSGKTTVPISVTVSIRNVGHATSPASVTEVRLNSNGRRLAEEKIPLARLAPGHASTQIAFFPDAEPHPGFVRATVYADSTLRVSGPSTNDVKRSSEIPVIAQRWTGVMEADEHTPGIFGPDKDVNTTTPLGVTFTFSGVNSSKNFAYKVGGKVEAHATLIEHGCTGEGDGSASMSRWGGDSGLQFSHDLTRYFGSVQSSLGPPFTVNVTCPDTPPAPFTIRLDDLRTEKGPAAGPVGMQPTQRVLHDHGHLGSSITIDYTWNLTADVP